MSRKSSHSGPKARTTDASQPTSLPETLGKLQPHRTHPKGSSLVNSPLDTAKTEAPWIPQPRILDHPWMSRADWRQRVALLLHAPARKTAKLVFLGDSITEGWSDVAPKLWEKAFGQYQPLKLGIGGDQTQNLLWRIDQGELRELNPHVTILLIGINNIWWGGFSPEDTARGIATVASRIRQELPQSLILVHGLFPAGRREGDEIRLRIQATNRHVQTLLSHQARTLYLDIGSRFVEPDGSICQKVMHDFLHLTEAGYERWADALKELLEQHISHPD